MNFSSIKKGEEPDEYNTALSEDNFTPDGGVMQGYSYECLVPFGEEDKSKARSGWGIL